MIIYIKCYGFKLEIGEREMYEGYFYFLGLSCFGGCCFLYCLYFLLLEKFMNLYLNI